MIPANSYRSIRANHIEAVFIGSIADADGGAAQGARRIPARDDGHARRDGDDVAAVGEHAQGPHGPPGCRGRRIRRAHGRRFEPGAPNDGRALVRHGARAGAGQDHPDVRFVQRERGTAGIAVPADVANEGGGAGNPGLNRPRKAGDGRRFAPMSGRFVTVQDDLTGGVGQPAFLPWRGVDSRSTPPQFYPHLVDNRLDTVGQPPSKF